MTTIEPAYGRDYKTAKEAKAAWEAGKDFIINDMFHPHDGRYVSIRDTSSTFKLRFCRQRKVCIVKGNPDA